MTITLYQNKMLYNKLHRNPGAGQQISVHFLNLHWLHTLFVGYTNSFSYNHNILVTFKICSHFLKNRRKMTVYKKVFIAKVGL